MHKKPHITEIFIMDSQNSLAKSGLRTWVTSLHRGLCQGIFIATGAQGVSVSAEGSLVSVHPYKQTER